MKIIALRGKANSGKTTTIKMLPKILNSNGYTQVKGAYKTYGGDFLDIYISSKGIKVGITSSGDTYDLVADKLNELKNNNCDVYICACRTKDMYGHGTIAATKSFGVTPIYIKKRIENNVSKQPTANSADAMDIFLNI